MVASHEYTNFRVESAPITTVTTTTLKEELEFLHAHYMGDITYFSEEKSSGEVRLDLNMFDSGLQNGQRCFMHFTLPVGYPQCQPEVEVTASFLQPEQKDALDIILGMCST